MMKDRCVVHY